MPEFKKGDADSSVPRFELDLQNIDWTCWQSLWLKVIDEGVRLYRLWAPTSYKDRTERVDGVYCDPAARGFQKMVEYSTYLLANYPIPKWTTIRREKFAQARALLQDGKTLPKKFQVSVDRMKKRDMIHRQVLRKRLTSSIGCLYDPIETLLNGKRDATGFCLKGETLAHCVARDMLCPTDILHESNGCSVPGMPRLNDDTVRQVLDELHELGYKEVTCIKNMYFDVDYARLCGEVPLTVERPVVSLDHQTARSGRDETLRVNMTAMFYYTITQAVIDDHDCDNDPELNWLLSG